MECDKASERPLKDNPMRRGVSSRPPAIGRKTPVGVLSKTALSGLKLIEWPLKQ
ncbi:hypothetical protein [Thermococcus sp.]|uniref:hypothetical protein n=1 Tax=Thermococcus sp. TaxID=35749 RepID=UPI00260B8DFF|nr:hypothetical protein [Thermococcus sp.]